MAANIANAGSGGFKAFAAEYFRSIGLFSNQLLIIPPCSLEVAKRKIQNHAFTETQGVTLRYSFQEELGLPRFFSIGKLDLTEKLELSHNPKWTTILHPYIDVRRSFELNITKKDWVLEHVPGMWESDNTLPPDQIVRTGDQNPEAILYKKERVAKIAGTERWSVLESKPTNAALASAWATKISPIVERLRKDFHNNLPLNFHFVEDKEGIWHFLNIRKGFEISHQKPFIRNHKVCEISSLDDLINWDRKSILLLKLTTSRGAEKQLLESIEWIGKFTRVVFVEFGLLSHPAILLREEGIRVLPARLLTQSTGENNYELNELHIYR